MNGKMLRWITAGACALLLVGCDGKEWNTKKIAPPENKAQTAVAVNAVEIRKGDIYQPVVATGAIMPNRDANVGAKISGKIERIFVNEGDQVRGNSVLFRLEQDDFLLARKGAQAELLVGKAALSEANLNLENAIREKARIERLYEKRVISQQKYDDANTAHAMATSRVDMAAAQLSRAETNLAMMEQRMLDSVVRAPFSGMVVKKFMNEAELAMPNVPVVAVMNIDSVKVEVQVPELQALSVRRGTPVIVSVDALPDSQFKGTISRINSAVNPQSHTFKVEIDIPNADHAIKAGMFARVTIKTDVIRDVVVVPPKAIITDDRGGSVVFVVRGNRAVLRKIAVGAANEHLIEIKEGLSAGEKVVVAGNYGMEENTMIAPRIVPY